MDESSGASQGKMAAAKAVEEWVDEYLLNVFGVKLSDVTAFNLAACPPEGEQVAPDKFIERLRARFAHLDLAPRDGVISIFEIEHAIANPRLNFDEADLLLLQLLKRFYHALVELSDDERGRMDKGISRADIEVLDKCLGQSCSRLRKRLEQDFQAP